MSSDFWHKSSVAVIGAGNFGIVLTQQIAHNAESVRVLVRDPDQANSINNQHRNTKYYPDLELKHNITADSDIDAFFKHQYQAILFVLPARVMRDKAREISRFIKGDEIIFHATKGVEEGTLKRMSSVLAEEISAPRIGVLSGPNLAEEIARGDPSATVIASRFDEVVEAGVALFTTDQFRAYRGNDMIGVEWAGTLKNILAIAAGCLDALGLGWNARAFLISRGIAEMVRFGTAMGAKSDTFLGLAGIGDLLATCGSDKSRNYRAGFKLGEGKSLDQVMSEIGSTVEGVRTTNLVWEFANSRQIQMPITHAVYQLIYGSHDVQVIVRELLDKQGAFDVRI